MTGTGEALVNGQSSCKIAKSCWDQTVGAFSFLGIAIDWVKGRSSQGYEHTGRAQCTVRPWWTHNAHEWVMLLWSSGLKIEAWEAEGSTRSTWKVFIIVFRSGSSGFSSGLGYLLYLVPGGNQFIAVKISPGIFVWYCGKDISSGCALIVYRRGRRCQAYRGLNEVTVKDAYPLPRIDDSLDALNGGKWFHTMDLMSGYWQVQMASQDQEKTAFSTSLGLFEFNVMPFGLVGAPATFERLMEYVLRGLQWEECLVYMDDIIITGSSVDQSLERLSHVFQRLLEANLKLKPPKCSLFRREVKFLGHIVCGAGIRTDPAKIEAVQEWPVPISAKQIRSFLGLCSYYRRFIHGFADLARPLHKLTEKSTPFQWTDECQLSFQRLKAALTSAPVLAYPRPEGQFTLDTDASGEAIGAVLSQSQDEELKVIGYFSKAMTKAERDYCITRKELLAVVMAVKHFHPYLYGRTTILRTDNAAVSWMRSLKMPSGQVARWLEVIGTYDLQVTHRPGRVHNNADALSRRPCMVCSRQQELSRQYQLDQEDTSLFQNSDQSQEESAEVIEDTTTEAPRQDTHLAATTRQQSLPGQGSLRINQGWLDGWDVEHLRLSQLSDEAIGPILLLKEADATKPAWPEVSHLSSASKALWSTWDKLEVKDGLLFKTGYNPKTRRANWQLLVPSAKRKEVFTHLHEHNTGGHLGVQRTLEKIKLGFYWPTMRRTIEDLCKKCDKCAARKPPLRKSRAPLQQYLVGEPLERIAVDILGPLPITKRGNRFVLVIGDYFTKFAEAVALPDQEAETVARAVVEEFICRYGAARQLHSDRGSNFESSLFQHVCKLLNIDKTRTTPRHPQSDGMVERFNRTLATMLTMYCESKQNTWDEHLPYVMLAYRSSVHDSTGFSPNMMMLGREVELPLQVVVGMPHQDQEQTPVEYVNDLQERLQGAHEEARKHLRRSAQHQKRTYEHKLAAQHQYHCGQAVWYYNSSIRKGRCRKLMSLWKGPYIVVGQLNDVTYLLQQGPRAASFSAHVDQMKPYRGDAPPRWYRGVVRTWVCCFISF